MQITLEVFRYNPEIGRNKPAYDIFTVEAEPTDRVLDLLEYIKDYQDGTLSFRRSCAHGVCGSDAMRINGANSLACKVLVKDVGANHIKVEPLLGLPIVKDLVVDMEPFFESYRSVLPYLINDEVPADGKERLQSQAEVDRESRPGDPRQRFLFEELEERPWRSTRSVLTKPQQPSSSES